MLTEIILVALAILYGVSMKSADLLNEHGLKWFRYADIFLGICWGILGAILIRLGGDIVANTLLAMNLAFIVRGRLDYLNHQLGTTIVILAFLLDVHMVWSVFLPFYAVFVIFGSLKDHRGILQESWRWLGETMVYYPLPAAAYALVVGNWQPFWVMLAYMVAYDITKSVGRKYPDYREQPG